MINANNIIDVRSVGYEALADALGPVGFVRFMQQYDNGYGDYTKEKYEEQEELEPWAQIADKLNKINGSEP